VAAPATNMDRDGLSPRNCGFTAASATKEGSLAHFPGSQVASRWLKRLLLALGERGRANVRRLLSRDKRSRAYWGPPHSGGPFSLSAGIAEAFGFYALSTFFGRRKKCWTTGPHDFAVRSNLHHPFDGHVLPTEVLAKALKRRSSARSMIAHKLMRAALQQRSRARRCRVHRIPSRVRDDRDTPLLPGWDGASW
jgi:hypothetical protein